ncbi:CHAD domain-containing protein [Amycolatopsis sp. NPDC059027]|uniref:CHAD domain-containing protein n=1 Tax=unclassified Amycolatopsis TaxID=2618356 RepID=UPI00366BDFEE
MTTEFFDTTGLRLLKQGFALTRRSGEWWLHTQRRCVLLPYGARETGAAARLVLAPARGVELEPVAATATEPGENAGLTVAKRILADRLTRPERVTDGSARDALLVTLHEMLGRIAEADVDVRLGERAAAVRLRVAVRCVRDLLGVAAPALGGRLGAGIRRELGWLAAELAPVHEAEVLVPRLRQRLAALPEEFAREPAQARVTRYFADCGRARAAAALGSRRYLQVLNAIDVLEVVLAETPRTRWPKAARRPASAVLPCLAASWTRKTTQELRRASRDRGLSQARHAVEKLRCLVDAGRRAGISTRSAEASLGTVGDLLDEQHVAVTAHRHLRALRTQAADACEDTAVFDALLRAEIAAIDEYAARAAEAWQAAHPALSPLWTNGT